MKEWLDDMAKHYYLLRKFFGSSLGGTEQKELANKILESITPYLWKCIYSFGILPEDKEDVFQDISFDCYLVLNKRWRGGGSFSALLKTNIVNGLRNYWAKRSSQKRCSTTISLDSSYYSFLKNIIGAKIVSNPFLHNEKLSMTYKLASKREQFVMRRVLDGYTYEEIGEVLGVKSCTIALMLQALGKKTIGKIKDFDDDPVERGLRNADY